MAWVDFDSGNGYTDKRKDGRKEGIELYAAFITTRKSKAFW